MKTLRTFALSAALALAAGCSGVSDEEWCAENDPYAQHLYLASMCPVFMREEWCERCGECDGCCYLGRVDEFPEHCNEEEEQ